MPKSPKRAGPSFDRFMPPSDRERKQALQKQSISRVGDEDKILEAQIKDLLANDPYIYVEDISVRVKKGRVEVSGVIDSQAQKERVEALLAGMPGVKDLTVNLTVGEVRTISDKVILDLVSKAIEDFRIPVKGLGLTIKGGKIAVSGKVSTLKDKLDLMRILAAIPGIREISDYIIVGFEEIPDDITLKNKVMLAISELGLVKVRDLKVRVSRGTVHLKGEAKLLQDKAPLIEKVASVKGVKEIVDEIVHEEVETEAEGLRRRIESQFLKDSRLSNCRINFEISGGTIFLQGEVRSPQQLYVIEEILGNFPQIKRVINELLIAS
ncbi:MAG: BON domain-containing protein [Caldiserica bacterium]|jgi:osmotically-inducible protein OsmY|nr:BON domain-containing protein [Caldisericota bacterium]MDH7562750.1 BON domain-containing protein [Caldisericota bacterium]